MYAGRQGPLVMAARLQRLKSCTVLIYLHENQFSRSCDRCTVQTCNHRCVIKWHIKILIVTRSLFMPGNSSFNAELLTMFSSGVMSAVRSVLLCPHDSAKYTACKELDYKLKVAF